jgi:ATP-dependent Zn protease
MENKSRVIKYENLRKQIANMDVYSFEDTDEVKKNIPDVTPDEDTKEVILTEGVKKNTLSMSLDQLIKSNESYHEELKKEETKKIYKKKKKELKKAKKHSTAFHIWVFLIPVILLLGVVIFFLIRGAL